MKKQGDPIRRTAAVSAVLLAALFLLPLLVVAPFRIPLFGRETPVDETESRPAEGGQLDGEMSLRVLDGETVMEMNLGEYLLGVVRAEMPASFHAEALRAQAVAARTYTLYKLRTGGNHGDTADICTDSACCQAYIPEDRARANWGEDGEENEAKIRQAVTSTDGEVILYAGEPVLAVFHSSSAGLTRAAGEVWRSDLPYLQAVSSPENGESIPNYYSRVELSREELRQKLLAAFPEADLDCDMDEWFRDAGRDEAGNISTVSVGGVPVRGGALRSALGLRSACITWELRGERAVFFVTGYGHGVGMSQYGADAMAAAGADYREILRHYYTGVVIDRFTNPGET